MPFFNCVHCTLRRNYLLIAQDQGSFLSFWYESRFPQLVMAMVSILCIYLHRYIFIVNLWHNGLDIIPKLLLIWQLTYGFELCFKLLRSYAFAYSNKTHFMLLTCFLYLYHILINLYYFIIKNFIIKNFV